MIGSDLTTPSSHRPWSVRWLENVSIALFVVELVLPSEAGAIAFLIEMLVPIAFLILAFLVTRKRLNWSRGVITAFFVLDLVFLAVMAARYPGYLSLAEGDWAWMTVLWLLSVMQITLLWISPTSAWLTKPMP